jgi:hypothetical protein
LFARFSAVHVPPAPVVQVAAGVLARFGRVADVPAKNWKVTPARPATEAELVLTPPAVTVIDASIPAADAGVAAGIPAIAAPVITMTSAAARFRPVKGDIRNDSAPRKPAGA